MINLAVINLKNLIKALIKLIIVTLVVTMIFKFISIIKKMDFSLNIEEKISSAQKEIITSSLAVFNNTDDLNKNNIILETEFSSFYSEEDFSVDYKENECLEIGMLEEKIQIKKLENKEISNNTNLRNLVTRIVEANNKTDAYTNICGSVKIKNESSYTLTDDIMNPNIGFSNIKDILIFHTHTCESYTPTQENTYNASGNFRTIDLNYSVAKVGNELTNCLKTKGYNVIHDMTYHDYPAYNGSYTRSLKTVKNILSNNSSTQLVIDLHRDALGSNSSYGPTVLIGEEQVAQLMFVIGTNGGGLSHDNWINNLKLAILIQTKANEMYPGLFKPMIVRNSRYNQNVADAACIIEVRSNRKYIRTVKCKYEIFSRSNK